MLKTSTAYGVPHLFRSKRMFNRIFWLCFLVMSTIVSVYYVYAEIMEYFKYEVVTTAKYEYNQPAQFPTVTFCARNLGFHSNLSQLVSRDIRFGYDYSIGVEPANHFESFSNQDHGTCFRFNSGKNLTGHSIPIKNTTIGGRDDSLLLRVNSIYTLIVWIHDRRSPPKIQNRNNHDSPVFVTNSTKTYLVIDKTVDEKLPEPYNRCLKDVTSFQGNMTIIHYILNNGESYSQVKCLELCFDLKYIEKNPCNCVNSNLGNVWHDCFNQKEKKTRTSCTYIYKSQFYTNTLTEVCAQYCPLECDSTFYSVSVSGYATNDNYTTIQVYYRSLKYTYMTQQAKMHVFDIISNIGGTLGLFVGLSFVSLFEMAEIFIETVYVALGRILNKNKCKSNNQNSKMSDKKIQKKLEDLFEQVEANRLRTNEYEKQLKHLANLIENSRLIKNKLFDKSSIDPGESSN
jgi:hypothetical protein